MLYSTSVPCSTMFYFYKQKKIVDKMNVCQLCSFRTQSCKSSACRMLIAFHGTCMHHALAGPELVYLRHVSVEYERECCPVVRALYRESRDLLSIPTSATLVSPFTSLCFFPLHPLSTFLFKLRTSGQELSPSLCFCTALMTMWTYSHLDLWVLL